jgi:hypothetical protein
MSFGLYRMYRRPEPSEKSSTFSERTKCCPSGDPNSCPSGHKYTDKKENLIFLKYKEIQSAAAAKSHMRKGFLLYEGMRKYIFPHIYEEAVSHI